MVWLDFLKISWQAGEVGLCEPCEVQQGQVQGSAPGLGPSLVQHRLGGEQIKHNPGGRAWGYRG